LPCNTFDDGFYSTGSEDLNLKTIFSLVLMSAAVHAAANPGPPRLAFLKEFPGSTPAYMSIEIDKDGKGIYKEAIKDDYPIPFELDLADWEAMRVLAGRIDQCKRPLESGLKVANMGSKTIRCFEGDAPADVKFNYTQDVAGQQLYEYFERIAESAQRYLSLERAVKYEKLGVNQELLLLQAAGERGRILGYDMYLPLLDRIIKNDSYMHMARERASQMADIIRAKKAQSGAVQQTKADK
jgi:hypothetical protein